MSLVDLILVSHEDLQEYNVGYEQANGKNNSIHFDDVMFQFITNHILHQEQTHCEIRGEVVGVADANEERNDQVHLDILELAIIEIVLLSHLVHSNSGGQHYAASDDLTADAAGSEY